MHTRQKLLLLAALAASFAYGAAAARYQLFPYPTVRALGSTLAGWFSGPGPARDGMFLERRGEGGATAAPNVDVIKELANVPYLRGFKLAQKVESVTMYDPDAALNGQCPVQPWYPMVGQSKWQACHFIQSFVTAAKAPGAPPQLATLLDELALRTLQ